eukprot:1006597_1
MATNLSHNRVSTLEIDIPESSTVDPPLLSYHVSCLKSSRCPSPLWKLWQLYEQFRWKITTTKCLLRTYSLPFTKNKYISNTDMLILISFITFQIVLFWFELKENLYWTTYNDDSLRILGLACGRVSVVIFALTWTLATRNTFWSFLFGMPLERALFYHIWIARYAIFLVLVHFVLILYYWSQTGIGGIASINENIFISTNISGLIALICVIIIFLFSLSYFRRNHWEFFLKTHWIYFLAFFYFAMKHHSYFWSDSYWIKIAIFCWIFDLLYRGYNCFLSPELKVLNVELQTDDIIKISIQQNNFKCCEGQYCFICIPAISVTESHPFSISNCYLNANNETQIEFHIKVLGDWTNKLKQLILTSNINDTGMLNWKDLKIFMEGPYGKTQIQIEKYNSIILMSGGIGITPMQNIFQHLMEYLQNNNITTIKRIHFIWTIRDPHFVTIKEFNQIHWQFIKQINDKNSFKENICINNTQIKTNYFVTKIKDNNKKNILKKIYGSGIQFNRPKLMDVINDAKLYGKCGIFACGPIPMINDVKRCSVIQKIDCHTEKFHF